MSSSYKGEIQEVCVVSVVKGTVWVLYPLLHIYGIVSDAPRGTIRFLSEGGQVEVVKFYWSPELLQFGDQVQFKIATRSYDNLVYAVDIVVEQTAKEIRFRVRPGVWL